MACRAPGCWVPESEVIGGIPLCPQHVKAVRDHFGVVDRTDMPPAVTSIVYYISLDDGVSVKIGTTTNPRTRFGALQKRATGLMTVHVAEPGSFREERTLHRKFRHLATGRNEYFTLTAELRQHMADVARRWPNWEALIDALNVRTARNPARLRGY